MNKTKHQEIEFVYENVDVDETIKRLEKAGARFIFDETYDIVIFDYPDLKLNDDGAWIRLRKIDGKKTTVAYKRREREGMHEVGDTDTGMKEIEFVVDDFEKAYDFFLAAGMIVKKQQEKRRIRYILDNVEFDIDFWPLLNPYLEVEGDDESQIDKACEMIGLDTTKKRIINNWFIYKEQGINLHDYKILTFSKQERQNNQGRGLGSRDGR